MKWKLPAIAAMVLGGVWLGTRGLSVTEDMGAKVEQFKQEFKQQAEAHAARSGARAPLQEDNFICAVCHMNLAGELLVATHETFGITCSHCHGLSYEHADDEGHETSPDVLFGRAEIPVFCERCHGPHESPEKVDAFADEWMGEVRPNGRELLDKVTCTDCHGTHFLRGGSIVD
jgi:hypothetical protein